MKRKTVSAFLIILLLVCLLQPQAFAFGGSIFVNGEAFDGSFAEAIAAAGKDGKVLLSGTVYTMPVGKNDGSLVESITIEGSDNARLVLDRSFRMKADDNLDVLTIKGNNVTVKNIEIDARWRVDYPLNVFCYTTNIVIDSVTVMHGIRGGVNVMSGNNILFRNVKAINSLQAGFGLANCGDASTLRFENCVTSGNCYRSGILLCGGYGPTTNVDASGITCLEGSFSVHDRVSGTISGGERAQITYTAPPRNADGEPIDTSTAMYYPLEKAYHHIRFGVSADKTKTAVCSIKTTAYGFDTTVYYDDAEKAAAFLHEGEDLVELRHANPIIIFIARVLNSFRIALR